MLSYLLPTVPFHPVLLFEERKVSISGASQERARAWPQSVGAKLQNFHRFVLSERLHQFAMIRFCPDLLAAVLAHIVTVSS